MSPITTFHYFYTLNIGESQNVPFKVSKFKIPLQLNRATNFDGTPKYPTLTKQMIHFQITPLLNSDVYHDEIFTNIQKYDITKDGLDVSVITARSNNNTGWGLHLQAYLSLTICFESMLILNQT